MRILLALAVVGCVHAQTVTPDERCAAQGMILTGMTVSSGSTSGVIIGDGRVSTTGGSISESTVQCRVPATAAERCAVHRMHDPAVTKLGYDAKLRNGLIAAGYILLIVPGVIASIGFIVGEHSLESDVAQAYAATSCDDVTE